MASVEVTERIAEALRAHPQGVALESLLAELPGLARRTLQRRLTDLLTDGRAAAWGAGKGRRFGLVSNEPASAGAAGATHPVSREGAEVRGLVRRPLGLRDPVGYRREFVDDYLPNRTAWIPANLREKLLAMGRSEANAQPAGTFARQILDRLLIDLSWASSRLEGNTYTRLDTQNLIEFGRFADGHDGTEAQMILNHKAAIELLVDEAEGIGFNRYTLQNLHALLSEGLLADPAAGGRVRRIAVGISGTVYIPTGIPQVVDECLDRVLAKTAEIVDPFEQSFFVMAQVPYLQPFVDVNKRTSRLAANIPLVKHNLVPLSFVDVPERAYVEGLLGVYELNRVDLLRDVYEWAYERSCRRYRVLSDAMPPPDPVRQRWRGEIARIVGATVTAEAPIDVDTLRAAVGDAVDASDRQTVLAIVLNELHTLHEGNMARFRVRPSEFRRWNEGLTPDRKRRVGLG